MNVVECMLYVHGMRNRRHGHDGSEDLRRPHLVQTMATTSLVANFGSNEAPEITCAGKGKARFAGGIVPRGIDGDCATLAGWVVCQQSGTGDSERRRDTRIMRKAGYY